MSTIADYSVFTKAFLASTDVDFSKTNYPPLPPQGNSFRYLAVVPLDLSPHLTPLEAMNFDWSKLGSGLMWDRVSCRDANGEFIGNIVRVQPGVREGSIRLVAKVAIPVKDGGTVEDISVNTFVLLRTDAATNKDLPIAVATISEGYTLHKHPASENDPLDDAENASYVSFTINHLNGYTSVDFNPDAYVTYDVTDALSHRVDVLEGKEGIEGLHLAFDTASGDLKLLNKEGNVLDQANLPIKADVIIAEGEEGYKYVKTDEKQDIHAAKAWMPEGSTAWETVPRVDYTMQHAALVVGKGSTPASRVFVLTKTDVTLPISTQTVEIPHVEIGGSTYMLADSTESTCNLFRVKGDAGIPTYHNVPFSGTKVTIAGASTTEPSSQDVTTSGVDVDVITHENTLYVLGETDDTQEESRYRALSTGDRNPYMFGAIRPSEGSSADRVLGIAIKGDGDVKTMYTFDEGAQTPSKITSISGGEVRWLDTKAIPEGSTLKYGLEAFVWTVKDAEAGGKITDPFFQQLNNSLLALGFHEGDDIALGTNIAELSTDLNGVDADDYIHGKGNKATREQEVDEQRKLAKEELVAWNAQHPALTENRQDGTIIDSSGLDVRNGSITLGCGSVGEAGVYGIQMKKSSESLDFTISHTTGNVQFDDNGHATGLTSSTLLSIEPSSYISGAPTCLILAKVEHNLNPSSEESPVMFTPVRMTAGFSVAPSYNASSGLELTIHDYRDNIAAIRNPDGDPNEGTAIIEVQAIYTHLDARNAHETVPAQQMHTYIGTWGYREHPECSFLCNKIEEWMTAVGLTDAQNKDSELYVVIRVY